MAYPSFKKESGQVSRLLLILAIVVLVATVLTYLILNMASKPKAVPAPEKTTVPVPQYEATLGNIRFVFVSARDRGNTLSGNDVTNKQQYNSQKSITTTERFIEVTIGAQNKGVTNTETNAWNIGNIVDSEGRNFVATEGYTVNPWLPENNNCGALLKPAFEPIPCTKIYEVSKESTGLKIQITTTLDNNGNHLPSGKGQTGLIDLIIH